MTFKKKTSAFKVEKFLKLYFKHGKKNFVQKRVLIYGKIKFTSDRSQKLWT